MIGKTISHYRILDKLGEGGMGAVYRAHDTKLDRDVALKFLPSNLNATSDQIARFELEAKAISALNHPNIATIHDVNEYDGQRFLVLEFIRGGTLRSRLKQLMVEDRKLSMAEVVEYGIQIAEALAHAHRHGIVHRDVKTENMMLTEEGKIKLTDFGLAKLRGSVHVTAAGSTLGTAAYMSPEQVRGEEIDHLSDIFSLGIVLYELATSRLPFQGEFEAALSYAILNEDPVPVASLRPDVSKEFERIVHRCLEKDKAKRYQDAGGIVDDLKRVQQGLSGAVMVSTKRTRARYTIAVAGLLVVVSIAAYFLLKPSHSGGPVIKTIAVLPFANLTEGKEEEFFSDGITDDILSQLAQISDLNVISRTSVMQYKGTTKSIREIGRELNAGVILEGSVRHAGNQVRIVAQLIDANNDKHLWAETYDREFKEVFAIQSEIARNIANALQARLSPAEKEKLRTSANGNARTYSLLLEAKYFASRQDSASFVKAIELFRRGLAVDSTDARLWAGYSGALFSLAMTGGDATQIDTARQAARRALELDDELAEAHAVFGLILHTVDWDWQGAEREFRTALTLEPGNAVATRRMAGLLQSLGRFDEALPLFRRAIELDPVALSGYQNLGIQYFYTNRLPEAFSAFRKILEMNPRYSGGFQFMSEIKLFQGDIDSAIVLAEQEPIDVWRAFAKALAYHAAGRQKEADAALASLIATYSTMAAYQIAAVYAYRNDADRAFEWLENARRFHDGGISQFIGDPLMKNIEKDPRYAEFLRKVKLAN